LLNLLNDPECMAFLSSKGESPIVMATLAKFVSAGLPPAVSAQTELPVGPVEINDRGSFFSPGKFAGGIFPGATPQARNLILVHEIAHLTGAIVPERGSSVQNDANNLEILQHCGKTLGIK